MDLFVWKVEIVIFFEKIGGLSEKITKYAQYLLAIRIAFCYNETIMENSGRFFRWNLTGKERRTGFGAKSDMEQKMNFSERTALIRTMSRESCFGYGARRRVLFRLLAILTAGSMA